MLGGGTLTVTVSEYIGDGGTGTFTQTGGTHTVSGSLTLGNSGTYCLYGGSLNVTGTIAGPGTFVCEQGGWLSAGTIAAGLNIAAGATLTKTGAGAMTICGPTSYATGSALNLSAGTLNLNSSGGDNTHRNLSITVGGGSVLNIGATQYLAALTVMGQVTLAGGTVSAGAVSLSGARRADQRVGHGGRACGGRCLLNHHRLGRRSGRGRRHLLDRVQDRRYAGGRGQHPHAEFPLVCHPGQPDDRQRRHAQSP